MPIKIKIIADNEAAQELEKTEKNVKKLGSTVEAAGRKMERRWGRLGNVANRFRNIVNNSVSRISNSFRRLSPVANSVFNKIGDWSLKTFQNMAKWAKRFVAGAVIAAFLTAGVGITKAVTTFAKFEQLQLRLEQVTGSAQAGKQAFEELITFTAKTPFQLNEVIEAASTLEAFGAKSKELIKPIGDLSVFMGISIPEAAGAFGRAFAAGAGAADILRERGVLTLVKLRSGISDLTKLTLPEFRKILIETLTDTSGRIAGGTAKLAATLLGKWSTTKDNITLMFKGFGDLLAAPLHHGLNRVNAIFAEFADIGWGNVTKAMAEMWADMIYVIVQITFRAFTEMGNKFSAFPQVLAASLQESKNIVKAFSIATAATFETALKNTIDKSEPLLKEFSDRLKSRAKEIKDSMPQIVQPEVAGIQQSVINNTNSLTTAQEQLSEAGIITTSEILKQINAFENLRDIYGSDIYVVDQLTQKINEFYKQLNSVVEGPPAPPKLFTEDWFKSQTKGMGNLDLGQFESKMSDIRQVWIDKGMPSPEDFNENFKAIQDQWWQNWQEGQRKTVFSSFNTANAVVSAFDSAAGTIASEFDLLWNKIFGEANSTFEKIAKSMVTSFTNALLQIAMKAAALEVITWIFPALKPAVKAGVFHEGGRVDSVPRYHDGGLRSDERLTIQQVGEYDVRRDSVNAQTLPTLNYINKTGTAPASQNVAININREGSYIEGGFDDVRLAEIEEAVQLSDDELAERIKYIIDKRRLTV